MAHGTGLIFNRHITLARHKGQPRLEYPSAFQDLLRILTLHKTAINILAATSAYAEASAQMSGPLYSFLIAFCEKNPKNQAALASAEGLQLFLGQLHENHGVERLLLAIFEGNYDLSASNAATSHVIDALIAELVGTPVPIQPCVDCLKCLAVANQIPVHRNQQQILQGIGAKGYLYELQQLYLVPGAARDRMLSILDLVCTCCVGQYNAAMVVAQGMVPLPILLKILMDHEGFEQLRVQASMLRCLQEIWWSGQWLTTHTDGDLEANFHRWHSVLSLPNLHQVPFTLHIVNGGFRYCTGFHSFLLPMIHPVSVILPQCPCIFLFIPPNFHPFPFVYHKFAAE